MANPNTGYFTDASKSALLEKHRKPWLSLAPRAGGAPAGNGLPVRRLGEPVLMIFDASASSFVFELRSRLNSRVLVGGPIAHAGDVKAKVASLLELCKQEASFRIDRQADGHVVKLLDDSGQEVGASEAIASEAMTQAMLKLIASQARRARIVHRA